MLKYWYCNWWRRHCVFVCHVIHLAELSPSRCKCCDVFPFGAFANIERFLSFSRFCNTCEHISFVLDLAFVAKSVWLSGGKCSPNGNDARECIWIDKHAFTHMEKYCYRMLLKRGTNKHIQTTITSGSLTRWSLFLYAYNVRPQSDARKTTTNGAFLFEMVNIQMWMSRKKNIYMFEHARTHNKRCPLVHCYQNASLERAIEWWKITFNGLLLIWSHSLKKVNGLVFSSPDGHCLSGLTHQLIKSTKWWLNRVI